MLLVKSMLTVENTHTHNVSRKKTNDNSYHDIGGIMLVVIATIIGLTMITVRTTRTMALRNILRALQLPT